MITKYANFSNEVWPMSNSCSKDEIVSQFCRNKMCLTLPFKFWWWQDIKKVSIGYANICSSVQDHRQKFSVLKYIGSEEQKRAMASTKWKLVLQGSIWRKVVMKIIRSWRHQKHLLRSCSPEADVIRCSKDHQELKIIRSWKTGSFRFVSNVVLITSIIAEE